MIEQVFGRKRAGLDWTFFEDLVRSHMPESQVLDFKSQLPSPDRSARLELARDIAAFANARGGVIAFGVRDEDDIAIELTPVAYGRDLESALKAIQFSIEPFVPGLEVQAVSGPMASTGVVLLAVPPSFRAPHAIIEDNTLGYYRRDGRRRVRMYEAAVEYAYRQRAESRRVNDAEVTRLWTYSADVVREGGICLVAQPLDPSRYLYPSIREARGLMNTLRNKIGVGLVNGEQLMGQETRSHFRAIEGSRWAGGPMNPNRNEDRVYSSWARIEQAGLVAFAQNAYNANSTYREATLRSIGAEGGRFATPVWLEGNVVSLLVAARATFAATGVGSRLSIRCGVVPGAGIALKGYDDSEMFGAIRQDTFLDTELDVESSSDNQDLLEVARAASSELYGAFGVDAVPAAFIREVNGRLSLHDPRYGRILDPREYCVRHSLPFA